MRKFFLTKKKLLFSFFELEKSFSELIFQLFEFKKSFSELIFTKLSLKRGFRHPETLFLN